jgi:hypothetical protein
VEDRGDDQRRQVGILGAPGALDELLDQLERVLRRDPSGHLSGPERALGRVLGPATLHLLEHRRAQIRRQPRGEQLRRNAEGTSNGPVRLLAPLAALGELDQACPQEHPDVKVQMTGVHPELVRQLAVGEVLALARPKRLEDA